MTSSVLASPLAALCSAAAEFNAAVAAIGDIDAAKVGIDGAKPALRTFSPRDVIWPALLRRSLDRRWTA